MIHARKKLGQHFLVPAWADRLVEAIGPRAEDRFLEIGPGPGALTFRLAPRVAHLTAVEVDPRMIAELTPAVPANVTLVQGDILEFDPGPLAREGPLRVAGNLPYNVSSPLLFHLIRAYRETSGIIDATLMLQREVAERLQAAPGTGDYGVLTISVQLHADVQPLLTLPPGAFRPAPKVHSSVVRLTFRPPQVPVTDEVVFEAMVRSMFTQRRKVLGNALVRFAESRVRDAADVLTAAGIDSRRRPETLQLEELSRLADAFCHG
jgi:16S rRNA (adenine1518-N6/adenine1519-N6)-dimethyltransferase